MTRLLEVFKNTTKRPMESIEFIIAFAMLAAGLYLASPFYHATDGSASAKAFEDSVYGPIIYAVVAFVLPPLPLFLGAFFERFNTVTWRTRATFWMFVSLTFSTLLRIIAVGPLPLTWVFSLTTGLIAAVCYLYVRNKA